MLLGKRYGDGARSSGRKKRRFRPALTALLVVLVVAGLSYGAIKMLGRGETGDGEQAGEVVQQEARFSGYGGQIPDGAAVINTGAGEVSRPAAVRTNPVAGPAVVAAPVPPVAPQVAAPAVVASNSDAASGSVSVGSAGGSTVASAAATVGAASARPVSARPVSAAGAGTGAASEEAAILMAEADRHDREGRLLEARATYASALAKASGYEQRTDIAVKLASVSERTLLGPRIYPGDEMADEYVVKAGDNLTIIGTRYKIPYQLIQRINRMSSDRLNLDQKLKVIRGPFNVKIFKSEFVLEVWRGNLLMKRFPIGVGAADTTPAGQYKVLDKVVNPAFNPPPSQRGIMQPKAGGAADNPIGTRWIKFDEHLGIHGTIEPDSIGRSASLGCIRMLNADVEYVYDFLIRGSLVEIID